MVAAALLAGTFGATAAETGGAKADAARTIIGTATMKPDRTIVLDLHGGPESHYALGRIEYMPNDPHYQAVLEHLGGLAPGQVKPVAPWPDEN